VHPLVVEVMKEVGIDLSHAKPQKLTAELAQGAELLVTMGCGDECPYVPGLRRADWPLRDPKGLPMEEVRAIRETIRSHVQRLIEEEQVAE
jgi:arsenate reductase